MPPTWKYERAGILLLACPIDKTNFPRILNPRGAKGATISTTRTRSRIVGYPGVRTTFSHMATPSPSSCIPGFSIKRIFPEHWPRGPRAHRTLLQYPHGPAPDHCLALPWCIAAWCTRHKSHVPIYPPGLDKTNFSPKFEPRGAKGATIPQLALGPVPEHWLGGRLTGGQNYV